MQSETAFPHLTQLLTAEGAALEMLELPGNLRRLLHVKLPSLRRLKVQGFLWTESVCVPQVTELSIADETCWPQLAFPNLQLLDLTGPILRELSSNVIPVLRSAAVTIIDDDDIDWYIDVLLKCKKLVSLRVSATYWMGPTCSPPQGLARFANVGLPVTEIVMTVCDNMPGDWADDFARLPKLRSVELIGIREWPDVSDSHMRQLRRLAGALQSLHVENARLSEKDCEAVERLISRGVRVSTKSCCFGWSMPDARFEALAGKLGPLAGVLSLEAFEERCQLLAWWPADE
jgi:hypothetical protein